MIIVVDFPERCGTFDTFEAQRTSLARFRAVRLDAVVADLKVV